MRFIANCQFPVFGYDGRIRNATANSGRGPEARSKREFLVIYTVALLLVFLLSAMMWHWQMYGEYFVCERNGLIFDFIPPFIRQGDPGNAYLKPLRAIYAIWGVYAALTVVIPGLAAWLLLRMRKRALWTS